MVLRTARDTKLGILCYHDYTSSSLAPSPAQIKGLLRSPIPIRLGILSVKRALLKQEKISNPDESPLAPN